MDIIRRCIRRKCRNGVCPITRNDLNDCKIVFKKVSSTGFVRGYCAITLYDYFKTILDNDDIEKLRWPVCREDVSSIEVKRLEKLLEIPFTRRVSTTKSIYWKAIFLETLIISIDEMLLDIKNDIIRDDGTRDVEAIAEITSNVTASFLYLYLLNKAMYRHRKNSLCDTVPDVHRVFHEIKNLVQEMTVLFTEHDLILAWVGTQVVPVLFKYDIPSNLV